MAVPFFVPDGDDQRSNGSTPQSQSTISSATQTPLQSPVNDEHLVQAFYEALALYSANLLQGLLDSPFLLLLKLLNTGDHLKGRYSQALETRPPVSLFLKLEMVLGTYSFSVFAPYHLLRFV